MSTKSRVTWGVMGLILLAVIGGDLWAQRGPGYGAGRGRRGPGGHGQGRDPQFIADRDIFHYLLAHHDQVKRRVKKLEDGVETVTESNDPEVRAKIREHVGGMYERIKKVRPIRMRDPLFAELFRHAGKIQMRHEDTKKGVRVTETSKDPYVAKLIQAHAEVVSLFVKNGFSEAHKNHAVPGANVALTAETTPSAACTGGQCGRACCGGASNQAAATAREGDAQACKRCPPANACPKSKCSIGAGCPSTQNCSSAAACPDGKASPQSENCPGASACRSGESCPLSEVSPSGTKCPCGDKGPQERKKND